MPKPRFELWGESLRELGVLILVFVPLDLMLEVVRGGKPVETKHWLIVTGFGVLGFTLMILGVEIERR